MEYLGHLISKGVSTDPKKVEAMVAWPRPKTVKVFRGFLGLTGYYCRFVKNYGIISKPLTELLKKEGFNWGPEVETTFERLKEAMSRVPILELPDSNKPFVLETDACVTRDGLVLMQEGRPLAFLSKALGSRHMGLSIYGKDFLAMLIAVEK